MGVSPVGQIYGRSGKGILCAILLGAVFRGCVESSKPVVSTLRHSRAAKWWDNWPLWKRMVEPRPNKAGETGGRKGSWGSKRRLRACRGWDICSTRAYQPVGGTASSAIFFLANLSRCGLFPFSIIFKVVLVCWCSLALVEQAIYLYEPRSLVCSSFPEFESLVILFSSFNGLLVVPGEFVLQPSPAIVAPSFFSLWGFGVPFAINTQFRPSSADYAALLSKQLPPVANRLRVGADFLFFPFHRP